MSHELHYTSAPRGLKPGSRGFCTVAATAHLPGPLFERLEALSGYQPVFPPHDPSAALNPVVFSHLRLTVGGKVVSVLSRISPAGLDYSGRPNKYAHHIVVEGDERPAGGPAWLISQPGFMQLAWAGEPREIPAGRTVPQGDRKPGLARAWQSLTGDGGWAGVLVEAFLADPRRTVFLVFRPGMNLLPLFEEALALLPALRRWDVDFSTYFSQLPQGVTCAWRGVLEGSDEAKNARRLPSALFLDLCHGLGLAEGSALVHLARTGTWPVQELVPATAPLESARPIPGATQAAPSSATDAAGGTGSLRPPRAPQDSELLPELARLTARAGAVAAAGDSDPRQRRRKRPLVLWMLLTLACVIVVFAACLFVGSDARREIAAKREKITEAKNKAEKSTREPETVAPAPTRPDQVAQTAKQIGKPQTQTPGADQSVPSKPTTDRPAPENAVEKSQPTEPLVAFFQLPPTQESILLSGSPTRAGEKKIANLESIRISDILNIDHLEAYDKRQGSWGVRTKSSGVFGVAEVAEFRAEGNLIHFGWVDPSKQAGSATKAVRDGVLKVTGARGRECWVLLRDPSIIPSNALSLTNSPNNKGHGPQPSDDFKPRDLSLRWADRKALEDTNWKLGIRRWRIVSRLQRSGPETVIAEGNQDKPALKVEQDIIPDEVRLKIEIDRMKLHLVHLHIEFDKYEIPKKRNERRALIDQDRKDRGRLAELKGTSEAEEIQAIEARISENKGRLEESERKKALDDHLHRSEQTDLRLVLSVQVDDVHGPKIIDVARFGEFPSLQR
jgi:hypothetical protein